MFAGNLSQVLRLLARQIWRAHWICYVRIIGEVFVGRVVLKMVELPQLAVRAMTLLRSLLRAVAMSTCKRWQCVLSMIKNTVQHGHAKVKAESSSICALMANSRDFEKVKVSYDLMSTRGICRISPETSTAPRALQASNGGFQDIPFHTVESCSLRKTYSELVGQDPRNRL